MIRLKRRSFLWIGCILMCLLFMTAGQSLAQCTLTSGGLDAALSPCSGDDLDCYVAAAKKFPSCSGNIAWQYMMLFTPSDPVAVQKQFTDAVSDDYADLLASVIAEANDVIDAAENAGSRTASNEYPFGQGETYGQ